MASDSQEKIPSDEEDLSKVDQWISELTERLTEKSQLRSANNKDSIQYPDESDFAKLDSSIKKNTAFVKKLKMIAESQKDSILKDMKGLNLTKYLSEVASALIEAKFKLSEVSLVISIASQLHIRYVDFDKIFLEKWSHVLPKKPTDTIQNAAKLRVDLRIFAELLVCGIFTQKESLPILSNSLIALTVNDKDKHANVNIILTFCKYCGDDYAGLVSSKMLRLAQKYEKPVPRSDFLPPERQSKVRQLVLDYFKSLVDHLIQLHRELKHKDRKLKALYMSKGEVPKERKEEVEALQLEFNKLLNSAEQFADLLDENLPKFSLEAIGDEDEDEGAEGNLGISLEFSNRFKDGNLSEMDGTGVWEDEDSRTFYQVLPDLKTVLPSILFKESAAEIPIQEEKPEDLEPMDESMDNIGDTIDEETHVDEDVEHKENEESRAETSSVDAALSLLVEDKLELDDEVDLACADGGDGKKIDSTKPAKPRFGSRAAMEAFLARLSTCVNRDMIDKMSTEFCTDFNTKNNRKLLSKALFTVQRTRLDLLPFYARLAATLHPVVPSVAADLITLLKTDFRFLVKKRDQINIETKVKNVRYIGELVKFGLFPKMDALNCLKQLLIIFQHHYIQMACNLLEVAGRYLYRSPDSHKRTVVLMEQMMRKKALLPPDSKYVTLIENAYYFANPPEAQAREKIDRPPIEQYIVKLIHHDLNRSNTDGVLRRLRRIDWDNESVSQFAINCLFELWHIKFTNIRAVANLLSGLKHYQDWAAYTVVDAVLEDIRLQMEINDTRYNQRRIAMAKYLAEMYNYRLVDSTMLYNVLYSLITFGVTYDATQPGELDPVDNFIRIRLVCCILDTSGPFFSTNAKTKLKYYLPYFQKYYWYKLETTTYPKHSHPVQTISNIFQDTLLVFVKFSKITKSLAEANEAVKAVEDELLPQIQKLLPKDQESDLPTIAESEEDPQTDTTEQAADDTEDSDSGSHSERELGSESEDSESDSEDSESVDENEEEEVLKIGAKRTQAVSAEDEAFIKELELMTSEARVSRSQATRSGVGDIVIPLKRDTKDSKHMSYTDMVNAGSDSQADESEVEQKKMAPVRFSLMTRPKHGNKAALKDLLVPAESDFVKNYRIHQEEERKRKEELKKNIVGRIVAQEASGSGEVSEIRQRPIPFGVHYAKSGAAKPKHMKTTPDSIY